MPKSRTGWGLLIGTAFLAVLVVIGIVPRLRQNAELVAASTAPDAGLVQVSVIAPKRADGPIHLVLPSNIQAIEEAAIYSRTSGYVRERFVDIGDRVAAGKALAQIDTPQLGQELRQAPPALAPTPSSPAQAPASLTPSQADLSQAHAALQLSKAEEGGARITAGSGNGASPPLFRIARVENLRIFVNVPQTFVRSIAVGQEVRVLVPEYPQRPFVGRIASTAGALDPASRTLLTEVRLRNDDHALMPGMYAQVKFSLVSAADVWVIPATALIARAAG